MWKFFCDKLWHVRCFEVNETSTKGHGAKENREHDNPPPSTSNVMPHYNFSFITINFSLFPLIYLRSFERNSFPSVNLHSIHGCKAQQNEWVISLCMDVERAYDSWLFGCEFVIWLYRFISSAIKQSHSWGKVLHHSRSCEIREVPWHLCLTHKHWIQIIIIVWQTYTHTHKHYSTI